MTQKSSISSTVKKDLEKANQDFQAFDQNVKELTQDRMDMTPKEEVEKQTKLSQKDLEKSKDIYLKPKKSLGPGRDSKTNFVEKFNEKYRKDYEFATEYVQFIAENKEIIGEAIEIWTKPFPGMNTEFWEVPTNIPVWGPRHLAEQITKAKYHRLSMKDDSFTGSDSRGKYFGTMVADTTIQRLDAYPAKQRKSLFMGASGF